MFIVCGRYGGVDAVGDRFEAEFKAETRRHFGLEPHHEQYEQIHATNDTSTQVPSSESHCNDLDIAEMTVDRLERNLTQSGGRGSIDWITMNEYRPVFTIGDVDRKRALFDQYLIKYEPIVRSVFLANIDRPPPIMTAELEVDDGVNEDGDDDTIMKRTTKIAMNGDHVTITLTIE